MNENNNVSLAYLHLHGANAVLWDLLAISCDRKTVIKKILGEKKENSLQGLVPIRNATKNICVFQLAFASDLYNLLQVLTRTLCFSP